jgi:riboflavin synthase
MFSGIIQTCGEVAVIEENNKQMRLGVFVKTKFASNLNLGASIAINGTCLTVSSYKDFNSNHVIIFFDVIPESLSITNLSSLQLGDKVNFERSLRLGDEIGGHLVSGHIITTAIISKIEKSPDITISCKLEQNWKKYLYPKTYITIDGISLTIAKVIEQEDLIFQVKLIPETISRTTLFSKRVGDTVNIEFYSNIKTIVDTLLTMNLAVKSI